MATAGWRARPRWLAGDSGLGFPPWEHLEDEGTEGILTMALVGAGGAVWLGDGGPSWQPEFLNGAVFGARRIGVGDGIGCGGEMGCSWVLYIGRGRLAEAAEERCRWRLVEFNGAAVSSLESALRGRGNGGAVPLWKGKWRRCSTRRQPAGRAVRARHQTGEGR
jgi:hypothetical protein